MVLVKSASAMLVLWQQCETIPRAMAKSCLWRWPNQLAIM